MDFTLKFFFLVLAVQPGVAYTLLDFCAAVSGRAIDAFSVLYMLYKELVLIYLQDLSQ